MTTYKDNFSNLDPDNSGISSTLFMFKTKKKAVTKSNQINILIQESHSHFPAEIIWLSRDHFYETRMEFIALLLSKFAFRFTTMEIEAMRSE